MRFNSIPALAAVLSLGAPGVLSSVIPVSRGVQPLSDEVTLCIKDLCASKGDKSYDTAPCGPSILAVTRLGAPSSVEECVNTFSDLIAENSESGSSETDAALYEIFADSVPQVIEKRKKTTTKKDTTTKAGTTTKSSSSKAEATTTSSSSKSSASSSSKSASATSSSSKSSSSSASATSSSKGSSSSASSSKGSSSATSSSKSASITASSSGASSSKSASATGSISGSSSIKPSGSSISSKLSGSMTASSSISRSATRTSMSASQSASGSACPLPRKDSNGKTIQRRCAGDEFYKKTDLIAGKVTHWRFNTMKDPKDYNADPQAKKILTTMKTKGQLDVVKINSGELTVIGNIEEGEIGGTDPKDFTKKGGNYILTNGGFFQHIGDPDHELYDRRYAPAGEDTKVKTADGSVKTYANPFPVPEDYQPYYTSIDGTEGTKVWSGPDLKKSIPEIDSNQGIWEYKSTGNPVGSLNHASQPNERLAIVNFGGTFYNIAYTSDIRASGLPTNAFKSLIDLFFKEMGESGKSISSSTKAVCLDGGPSISLIWNEGNDAPKYLALGQNGDNTPLPGASSKVVSNLIKVAVK